MSATESSPLPPKIRDSFYVGGEWVKPSSSDRIHVIDSHTEEEYFSVAEAHAADVDRAVSAAHKAFYEGPWPRLSPVGRAEYVKAIGAGLMTRSPEIADLWAHQTGVLHQVAQALTKGCIKAFDKYVEMARTFPFEERATPSAGAFGLLVREPVGVVAAIIPWNAPVSLLTFKIAPALLAGCTVVLKLSPEAPGEGYILAEVAEDVGLPPGVLNVITADREVSELVVRDPRVDKITFTGSTAAGKRIGALCADRVARCTLELGGKSAAVILDDADLQMTAETLAKAECFLTGQVCASLTRIVVPRKRHDQLLDAIASIFSQVKVGDPFDHSSEMGPLVADRQRNRVEGYIAKGVADGATLAAGGGRPKHLEKGWYVEPTVFGNVDNSSLIAQEEIFGPVLSVIPAKDEEDAIAIANDSIYGLNAAVFTNDVQRAREVAAQLRAGTVAQNAFRTDFSIAFGGFKQSGVGREGGVEGLLPFLEVKTLVLDGVPALHVEPTAPRLWSRDEQVDSV